MRTGHLPLGRMIFLETYHALLFRQDAANGQLNVHKGAILPLRENLPVTKRNQFPHYNMNRHGGCRSLKELVDDG